tara:strand:- start:666 stop:812 length:147 start_codon:yes stop_codon:yes gene_type:complete
MNQILQDDIAFAKKQIKHHEEHHNEISRKLWVDELDRLNDLSNKGEEK